MISSVLKVITGIVKLRGGTDDTIIGNSGSSLNSNVTASALPSGASTSANQSTVIANQTNKTQFTKLTDGTDDGAFETSTPGLSTSGLVIRPLPFEPQRYRASSGGFAIAASATDVFRIVGSGSKTVRVTKMIVSGRTTSGSPVAVVIHCRKRSTANTGGTEVGDTEVPLDSNNSAATATVGHYTANPTLGTDVGVIDSRSITFQQVGLSPAGELILEFKTPVVLRGTSEQLSINFNATSVTGSSIACVVEWEEV